MSQFVHRVNQLERPVGTRLSQLDIELTERCNNDCIHCCINLPVTDAEAVKREMTTAQVKDILIQAADKGCMQVRFTGGEPLLRSDFEELYIFTRRLGMKVLLFTNGRLITSQLAELFARIPPLVPIEITVYGMHQGSYEAVTRSPGSFAQYNRGVNRLLDRGIPFVIKSVLLPQNRADIDEFEAWSKKIPEMIDRPRYVLFFDLRNRRDDDAKNRLIKSLRLLPAEGIAALTRDAARYRKNTMEFASKFMGPQGDQLFACGAGCGVCVDAYGRAQPCLPLRVPELTMDIADNKRATESPRLSDALEYFTRLREMRATNPAYLYRCARCFLKGLCEQCPAKSWSESGTLDTPVEYLCDVAHAQARYLGWLHDDERAWEVDDWKVRIQRESLANETVSVSGSRVS